MTYDGDGVPRKRPNDCPGCGAPLKRWREGCESCAPRCRECREVLDAGAGDGSLCDECVAEVVYPARGAAVEGA